MVVHKLLSDSNDIKSVGQGREVGFNILGREAAAIGVDGKRSGRLAAGVDKAAGGEPEATDRFRRGDHAVAGKAHSREVLGIEQREDIAL